MSVSPTASASRDDSSISPDAKPPLATTTPRLQLPNDANEPRRSSIQFLTQSDTNLPSQRTRPSAGKRRLSSPPPPPVFQPRVSFDTFDRNDAENNTDDNSFTLVSKHKDYEYTKRSRTFLCGCDDNDYSDNALQWLIDELVDDGDEIVCLRVIDEKDSAAADKSIEHKRYRSEAHAIMKQYQAKNHENKAINLILEFAVGKVHKVIDEMINLYEPAILVVGTRGRNLGGFQGLLPGSVSKYCLQSSPVPVIVVLPSSKRDKSRVKRAQDPSRQSYKELLDKSGPGAGYPLASGDKAALLTPEGITGHRRRSSAEDTLIGSEKTSMDRSMKRLSLNRPVEQSPLAQVHTAASLKDPESAPASPEVIMKSPHLRDLDSPYVSGESSSEDDDDDEGEKRTTGRSAEEIATARSNASAAAAAATAPVYEDVGHGGRVL